MLPSVYALGIIILLWNCIALIIWDTDYAEINCKCWLQTLSDESHFEGEDNSEHNIEYDHDAFLGKEEAKSFDQLSPDESRLRLGLVN